MSRRLSTRHRRWLYSFVALLWLSGLGWVLARYALRSAGPFGDAPHPSEPWWLRVHGAAVIGFLVAFGAVLPEHARRAWQQGVNRASGLSMMILAAALAVSGYGLYYLVSDTWRARVSVMHWTLGLLSGVALVVHVLLGRRLVARARPSRLQQLP